MSQEMDTLANEVAEMGAVVDSAVAFIGGLADQIRDAAGDREKSVALAAELDTRAATLANAIATPGARRA